MTTKINKNFKVQDTHRLDKFQHWKTLLASCTLAWLVACTGGKEPTPSPPGGGTKASKIDVGGDAAAGAIAWIDQRCNNCHGTGKNQGTSGIDPDNLKFTDFDNLVSYIEETMPKSYGPINCVGKCARDTAQYMLSWGTDLVPGELPNFAGGNLRCTNEENVERPSIVRLSPIEYARSLKDLFNLDSVPSLDELPNEELEHGFKYAESVGIESAESYSALARKIASDIEADYSAATACSVNDDECAVSYLSDLTERAFRIPVKDSLLNSILTVYEAGKAESIQEGVKETVEVILQSPFFLYRPNKAVGSSASQNIVAGFSNASHLSYLLTGSIPDEQLWADTKANKLSREQLIAHAQRLLQQNDTREYLSREFIGRWFKVKNVDDNRSDLSRSVMQEQIDNALTFIMKTAWGEEGSFERMLTEQATGNAKQNQLVNDNNRIGLLTQPAWATKFGSAERTEPILRGVFFVEDLLCRDVPTFNGDVMFPEPVQGLTLRDQLKVHRENPVCASCHALFDPMGLAFEEYDQFGGIRSLDNGVAIKTGGVFPTVDASYDFIDVNDLLNYVSNSEELRYCATKHWMAYAYRVDIPDALNCELESLVESVKGNSGLEQMIIETLKQTAFFGE